MNKAKLRRITIISLFCVLACMTVLVLFGKTSAFYVSRVKAPETIDFNIEKPTEIRTADEFRDAILQGHSVVKVADSANNPLYLAGEELELKGNLTIDLNGHDLKRNGRDPVVKVNEGKTLTIFDSVKNGEAGSFYNPVGSVLEVNGGTLTVYNGKYESGVRDNEYTEKKPTYTGETYAGTVADSDSAYIDGKFYIKTGEGENAYTEAPGAKKLPVITPTLLPDGENHVGDLYQPAGYGFNRDNAVDFFNPLKSAGGGDYYIYYVPRSNATQFRQPLNPDFFYIYKYNQEESLFEALEKDDKRADENPYSDPVYDGAVFIYGYYKNKATANLADTHYGAVIMKSGSLLVTGGEYYSYFENDTAYCVYSTGGDLIIDRGSFSTIGLANCVTCQIEQNGAITVNDGDFSSQKGDILAVNKGSIEINGGSYTKNVSAYSDIADIRTELGLGANSEDPTADIPIDYNGAMISVTDGTLNVSGGENTISFTADGSFVVGVECEKLTLNTSVSLDNAKLCFNKKDDSNLNDAYTTCTGVYNKGGSVFLDNALVEIPADNSVGIKSENAFDDVPGEVKIDTKTNATSVFVMAGKEAKAIESEGGIVTIGTVGDAGNHVYDTLFYLDHVYNVYGIKIGSATNPAKSVAVVNLYSVQFFMGQVYYEDENGRTDYYTTGDTSSQMLNSCGILINADKEGSAVNVWSAKMFYAGSYSAGIFARAGEVNQTSANKKFAIFCGADFKGYTAEGLYDTTQGSNHVTRFGKKYCAALYADSYYKCESEFSEEDPYPVTQTNAIGSYGLVSLGGKITIADLYVGEYSTYGSGVYATSNDDSDDYLVEIGNYKSDVIISDNKSDELYTYTSEIPDKLSGKFGIGKNQITSSAIKIAGGNALVNSCKIDTDSNALIMQAPLKVVTVEPGEPEPEPQYVKSSLEFGESGATSFASTIKSTRAAAIRMEGGKLMVRSGDTLTISKCSVTEGFKNERGEEVTPNAVSVTGGDFLCYGNFSINEFNGVNSDNSRLTTPRALNFEYETIKSFAVKITGGSFRVEPNPDLLISSPNEVCLPDVYIDVKVGGGVSVEGGTAILGTSFTRTSGSETDMSTVTIITRGNSFEGEFVDEEKTVRRRAPQGYSLRKSETDAVKNWRNLTQTPWFYSPIQNYEAGIYGDFTWRGVQNITGGHPLQVLGGDCKIYNGMLSAALGNGIYIKNPEHSNATVEIHGGTYNGYAGATLNPDGTKNTTTIGDSAYDESVIYTMSGLNNAGVIQSYYLGGPAAYYGMKVIGEANVKIYGGSFDGGNGGAFVTGFYTDDNVNNNTVQKPTAKVLIYEGEFYNRNGADGFNAADNSEIVFGAYTQSDVNTKGLTKQALRNAIRIESPTTIIAVNSIHNNKDATEVGNGKTNLNVYYGSYYGTGTMNPPSFIGAYMRENTVTCPLYNNCAFEEGTSKMDPQESIILLENFIQKGKTKTIYKVSHPSATNTQLVNLVAGSITATTVAYNPSAPIIENSDLSGTNGGVTYRLKINTQVGDGTGPVYYSGS